MKHSKEVIKYFNNPSKELVDFYVIHKESHKEWYQQPCYMNLTLGLSGTRQDYDPKTRSYTTHGPATGVYLGLRLPSKYATGMDVEDDKNREQSIGGAYVWEFAQQGTGNATIKDDQSAIMFWNFIFGTHSPWRKAMLASPEYVYNAKDEPIAVYFPVDDTIDCQTFVSMAMASRIPWQSVGHLRVFRDMMDTNKFDAYEALFVAAHLRYLKDEKTLGFRVVAGHFPFAAHDTEIAIEWFKAGAPHTKGLKLTKVPEYGNVDHIWDRQKRPSSKQYTQREGRSIKDAILYKVLCVDGEYKGAFAKAYKKTTGDTVMKGVNAGTWDVVLPKLVETRSQWSQ